MLLHIPQASTVFLQVLFCRTSSPKMLLLSPRPSSVFPPLLDRNPQSSGPNTGLAFSASLSSFLSCLCLSCRCLLSHTGLLGTPPTHQAHFSLRILAFAITFWALSHCPMLIPSLPSGLGPNISPSKRLFLTLPHNHYERIFLNS